MGFREVERTVVVFCSQFNFHLSFISLNKLGIEKEMICFNQEWIYHLGLQYIEVANENPIDVYITTDSTPIEVTL